jgi:hypothetical protein
VLSDHRITVLSDHRIKERLNPLMTALSILCRETFIHNHYKSVFV